MPHTAPLLGLLLLGVVRAVSADCVTERCGGTHQAAVEALRASGVATFVEVGAGNVLSGLVKRIDRGLTSISVSAPEHIAKARELVARA